MSLLVQVATSLSASRDAFPLDAGPLRLMRDLAVPVALALVGGLALMRAGLQFVSAYLPAKMVANLQAQLRREVLEGFGNASWGLQSREGEGHLQDVLTYQVSHAVFGLGVAINGAAALATFVTLVVAALLIDPVIAMVMLASGAVMFASFRPMSKLLRKFATAAVEANGAYASEVSETVRLTEEISAFGVQQAKARLLDSRSEAVRLPQMRAEFWSRAGHAVYQLVAVLFIVGGLVVMDMARGARVASLGTVVLILVRAASYGGVAQSSAHILNQFTPNLDAVSLARERYRINRQPLGSRPLTGIETLSLRDASFEYVRGRPVISEASFDIRRGEVIGIVGPSGSGKSTCLQLLLGLRPPTKGRFLVNGVPADEFTREDWTRLVAYVPQEARVMSGSVADNIRFFRKGIDDDRVCQAARLAHIHDEIERLSAGYDTVIGQRADALSGGQLQRLCLARALVGQPDLLVLDEPTSSLDSRSEALVHTSLQGLKGRLTIIIVAHRLSLVQICDRIMVFQEGRVEAFEDAGRVEELSDYYRDAIARFRNVAG